MKDILIAEAQEIMSTNDRVAYVTIYPDGFVPNAYKWRCSRTRYTIDRNGNVISSKYDGKRSGGRGPQIVAFSEKHGRLYSR